MGYTRAVTLAAIITLLTVSGVFAGMAFTRVAPDALLVGAMTVLIVLGVLAPLDALAGFANPAVITIAALYVVAAGLRETGAVHWVASSMLGLPKTVRRAQLRLVLPSAVLSAFLNNTTVVAIFIPAVQQWAQKLGIAPSKLLMILSYTAILGGTCTLIGTSTNLVVDGLLKARGDPGFGIFDLAWVGVPMLIAASAFLIAFSSRLLPAHGGVADRLEEVRQYAVEVEVEADSTLIGKSIAGAGLRNLANGYLTELVRGGTVMPAVGPQMELEAGDVLMFVGSPDVARELRSIQGLRPARTGVHKLGIASHQRCLVEAVVSPDFPYLDQTVKEMQFRTRYRAAILSISRAGSAISGKLGDIRLRAGDTLLMETDHAFVEQYRNRRDFLLVSAINDSTPPDFRRAPHSLTILLLMVAAAASNLLTMMEAALLAAATMLVSRCVTVGRARAGINFSVLIVIGASFALGRAIGETGLGAAAAQLIVWFGHSPLLALALVYLATTVLTEMITNNAAAVLMFTIAVAVAEQLGLNLMPFVVAVMFAASAAFLTPIGYQTNLMIMGPGGYVLRDYLRVGLPTSAVAFIICMLLIPRVWPF